MIDQVVVRGFGLILLLKAVDLATRLEPILGPGLLILYIGPWIIASILLVLKRVERFACSAIVMLVAAALIKVGQPIYNQHFYLIASIALLIAIFGGTDRMIALKAQLSIMYGFAALAKINADFLSGGVIESVVLERYFWDRILGDPQAPRFLVLSMTFGGIATEAWLAVGFWFKKTKWLTLVLGLSFQLVLLLFFSTSMLHLLRLAVFGLLAILLYVPFFTDKEIANLFA